MLASLLPGCALPMRRTETPPPAAVAAPLNAEVLSAEGPKVEIRVAVRNTAANQEGEES